MTTSYIFTELVPIFHSVNKFLGSDGGELLAVGFEFFLFLFIAYMATGQYLRAKNKQLKYLSIAFLTLALVKGIITAFLTATVFGDISRVWVDVIIPPFEHSFEVLALYLVSVALTYQLLRVKFKSLKEKFYAVSGTLTIAIFSFLIYWELTIPSRPYELFIRTPQFSVLALAKLIILGTAVFLMIKYYDKAVKVEKYSSVIIQALAVYAIPSIFHLVNVLFHNGMSQRLIVAANPFPFLAVFLFIRYSYLKMADKASLIDKLDLTERKYKKIKQITKLKDEFVSIASHELKTPLTSINLYTSLLVGGNFGQVTDEQKEALMTLKDETKRLTNLVNDLLDLSRIQNRKLVLQKTKTNFHKLTESVLFGFQGQNGNVSLHNKVPKNLNAHLDPERIKQVLINLVGNAVKFTDQGSITVTARENEKSIVFSVEDNGRGIPKEKLSYLFQKFYQVDPHLAREEGISGLGLGLSIVKGIIDAHDGIIAVDSEINKGTKFSIKLPQGDTFYAVQKIKNNEKSKNS